VKRSYLAALIVVVVAAGALVAGCGSDDKDSSKPSVSFTAPMDGSTQGDPVTATVKLEDFAIAPSKVGGSNSSGKGHLHFSLDAGKYDYPKYSGANGALAKKLGVEGKYSPSVKPTITYKNIPAGEHTLTVNIANNDHSDEGAQASTTFMVGSSSSY